MYWALTFKRLEKGNRMKMAEEYEDREMESMCRKRGG